MFVKSPKKFRNLQYLKDLEKQNGRMIKSEYLAKMRKFRMFNHDSNMLEIIEAFSKKERLVGIKNNDLN